MIGQVLYQTNSFFFCVFFCDFKKIKKQKTKNQNINKWPGVIDRWIEEIDVL